MAKYCRLEDICMYLEHSIEKGMYLANNSEVLYESGIMLSDSKYDTTIYKNGIKLGTLVGDMVAVIHSSGLFTMTTRKFRSDYSVINEGCCIPRSKLYVKIDIDALKYDPRYVVEEDGCRTVNYGSMSFNVYPGETLLQDGNGFIVISAKRFEKEFRLISRENAHSDEFLENLLLNLTRKVYDMQCSGCSWLLASDLLGSIVAFQNAILPEKDLDGDFVRLPEEYIKSAKKCLPKGSREDVVEIYEFYRKYLNKWYSIPYSEERCGYELFKEHIATCWCLIMREVLKMSKAGIDLDHFDSFTRLFLDLDIVKGSKKE